MVVGMNVVVGVNTVEGMEGVSVVLVGVLQSMFSYKLVSSFDVCSVETATTFPSSFLDGVYKGL